MEVCFNGHFFSYDSPLLTAQNRCFKWGDGVFETMKVYQGKLLLETLHFERLFVSMQLLQIRPGDDLTKELILKSILALCEKNKCGQLARIRLAVFRNEDEAAGYLIEAIPMDDVINQWSLEGQVICLYPYARKAMDAFANIKSANFLPYVLAQKYAAERKMHDAIVLNANNFLCDSSNANLFLIKEKTVYTPALHQGCINGVMRRVVIEEVKKMGYKITQDEISEEQLLDADEVFLTNAIQIIRWVKQYKNKEYSHKLTAEIFAAVKATIFSATC
jgi:branched-chain amino acid aminotransferase